MKALTMLITLVCSITLLVVPGVRGTSQGQGLGQGLDHGDPGPGCEPCHGHDSGYEYAPEEFSEGRGTFISHSTHTENDGDDIRGPFLGCDACHDITNYPYFVSGAGDPPYDLTSTDVCDGCHSAGGAYDGIHDDHGNSVGAKDHWNGVYNATGTSLLSGMERWCVGCHDTGSSVVDGVSAPSVELFFVSGHGRVGFLDCTVCHDVTVAHVDGEDRTYSFDPAYYAPEQSGMAYAEGYRLKYSGGEVPLMIPCNYSITFGYNAQLMAETAFRMCFRCHDSYRVLDNTPGDGVYSNFKASLPNPPRNYSYGWGSGADINEHVGHILNYIGAFGDSDWDAGTTGQGAQPGLDTTISCSTCHNVHGAAGLDGSTNEPMIRDGELAGRPGGYGFSYVVEADHMGGYPHVTSTGATGVNSVGAVFRYNTEVNGMCGGGMCHGNPTVPPGADYDATGSGWGTHLEYYRPWLDPTPLGIPVVDQVKIVDLRPNPARHQTTLHLSLQEGTATRVRILDVQGELIHTLCDQYLDAGRHELTWNLRDEHGRPVAQGVYLYAIQTEKGEVVGKLVVIR